MNEDEWRAFPMDEETMRFMQQRILAHFDASLFEGLPVDGNAATSFTDPPPDEGLTLEKLEQTVKKLLADVKPYDQAMQRLAERLKREPTIRYIANEWIPGGDLFWWEEKDVLLIAAAQLETTKQQFEQLGITLIEVDEAWWREMAERDFQNWLRPHLPKTI